MASAHRTPRLVITVAAALLLAYGYLWSQVTSLQIGRSDFTSTYVGATLLRTGHAAALYDEPVQAQLHATVIAPDTEGNLPFVDAPLAAVVAAPITLLPLHVAYWLWSVLQLAVLVAAVLIAVRSAPWPARITADWKLAAAATGIVAGGTMVQLLQAQWAPFTALGLALAYSAWRGQHHVRGSALLVIAAGIAKPHLAIGLIVFMLGWRNRAVLAGALTGALAVAAGSLLVAGPRGVVQFLTLALTSNTRWELRTFSGFVGIPGSLLGNSGTAQIIGAAGSVLALAVAWMLGAAVRRDAQRLDAALAGAAVLSLLAAPHAGTHDLVMLAPALAWCVALGLRIDAIECRRVSATLVAAGLAALLTCTAFLGLIDGGAFPPGQLTPLALILCAAIAWRAAHTSLELHPVPSSRDEAAVGAVADGVRGGPGPAAGRMLPLHRRSG